jgi:hypothetical protein
MSTIDLMIQQMVDSYKEQTAAQAATKVQIKEPKVAKAKKAQATVYVPSVKVGTIDAATYRQACKDAGFRIDPHGKRVFDADFERSDMIEAIDQYIGFNPGLDFASQELMARMKAARDARIAQGEKFIAAPTRQEKRLATASLNGYVAGLPSPAKLKGNLEARELKVVEEIIRLEKEAMVSERPERALALADVERERLKEIQKDLAELAHV